MGNTVKTALLLGALTGLLMLIGGLIGGRGGVFIAFIFAMILNLGSYWFSDKIVLKMYHAQEVSESSAPGLFSIVHNLALKAQLPMPRVYIIPEEAPNAFATGRNEKHAVVAVTEGIMRILNKEELEGVIAHELSHIKNRDMLIGSIAATLPAPLLCWLTWLNGRLFSAAAAVMMMTEEDNRTHCHGYSCPHCRDAHPNGHFPFPRISGGFQWCGHHEKSIWLGRSTGKALPCFANNSPECQTFHRSFIYRQSAFGKITHESFQHSPSAGR